MTDRNGEISGVVEIGRENELAGGFVVALTPTNNPRKFYIRLRPSSGPTGRVKHRRHGRKGLTEERKRD